MRSFIALLASAAAGIALLSYHWQRLHKEVAREKGITDEEIGAVQSIVMAVEAGRARAQFRETRERG